tara:strand:- start:261 stop:590 length:330 start_codon:yes stop_codon:yes gene_type:complete
MHQFDLKNRTAIITGGAQCFDLGIAKKFLQSGANVIIWDIDKKELEKASKAVNNTRLSYNLVDILNFEIVNDAVKEITKSLSIDIFINNVGITGPTAAVFDISGGRSTY